MQDIIEVTPLLPFEQQLTKSNIKTMAEEAIAKVKEDGNPLMVAEAISAMELFIKEVKGSEEFKEYVREEVGKTPKGFVSKSGAKIECCETGTKYNFDNCNDPDYNLLHWKAQAAQNDLKEREEFLKAIPVKGLEQTRIDEESGEVVKYTIYPPAKTSSSSYKITLAR